MFKKIIFISSVVFAAILIVLSYNKNNNLTIDLPLVAIANYGPHSSLDDSIKGFKSYMASQGFIEHKNIAYKISNVGFDSNLIPQMISQLKSLNPKVMLAMTTPVAQAAKNSVKDIPLVFGVITDPVEAGLLKTKDNADANITGASDQQDLDLLLKFAKQVLPNAYRVGVLYSTSEANDKALVKMLEVAAAKLKMQVVAIAVDQPRDVPIRMQGFRDNVDFIYIGTSGPIQPTLAAIVMEADKMHIPIFNVSEEAVQKNQVLGSFGVDYVQVGANAGRIVAEILKGEKNIPPIYPTAKDHHGFISKKRLDQMKLGLPKDLSNIKVVE